MPQMLWHLIGENFASCVLSVFCHICHSHSIWPERFPCIFFSTMATRRACNTGRNCHRTWRVCRRESQPENRVGKTPTVNRLIRAKLDRGFISLYCDSDMWNRLFGYSVMYEMVEGQDCGDDVAAWLSSYLQVAGLRCACTFVNTARSRGRRIVITKHSGWDSAFLNTSPPVTPPGRFSYRCYILHHNLSPPFITFIDSAKLFSADN